MAVQVLASENIVEERKEFYAKHPNFFSDIPGLEYGLYETIDFKQSTVDSINKASQELWNILLKIKDQVKAMSLEQFKAFGYDERMYDFIQLDYLSHHSQQARFDFILDDNDNPYALELNSITPFLIYETFEMNNKLCEHFGLKSPNTNSKNLLIESCFRAVEDALRYLGKIRDNSKIVIASQGYDDDYEEYETVQFLKSHYVHHNVDFELVYDLRVIYEDNDEYKRGVYTSDMQKIDVLILPAHPLDFIVDDVSEDGDPIGIQMLELVKDKELALINSPATYILQSKMTFAFLWHFYEDGINLSDEERKTVEKYMLPTYTSSEFFENNAIPYVKKSIYGREGSSVEIFKTKEDITKSKYDYYNDFPSVYQQFLELPKVEVVIEGKKQEKHFIVGSFMTNGIPSGIACRLGGEITEWDSHWLAISVEEENK